MFQHFVETTVQPTTTLLDLGTNMNVTPYKIHIADSELELLNQKLDLTRLPANLDDAEWGEDNKVTLKYIATTVRFWRRQYDWRAEEEKLNHLPQFTTKIDVDDGYGTVNVHFVHSKATNDKGPGIPLLFLHGWPGSFIEIKKILSPLNDAGFHVIAPSLCGYGFSSYTHKSGFTHRQQAEVFQKLMSKLNYNEYVVQGGDWGAGIARVLAVQYPQHVKAIHQNMVKVDKPNFPNGEPEYSDFEKRALKRTADFKEQEAAYAMIQSTKPRTLGFAMHDSPVAMLAWMADKLFTWTDDYPWTQTEVITWTLLHYFPGPTTGFQMYCENTSIGKKDREPWTVGVVKQPHGVSAFPRELYMCPRSWLEESSKNVKFWKEHEHGGHFAAWEQPDELSEDLISFFKSVWKH